MFLLCLLAYTVTTINRNETFPFPAEDTKLLITKARQIALLFQINYHTESDIFICFEPSLGLNVSDSKRQRQIGQIAINTKIPFYFSMNPINDANRDTVDHYPCTLDYSRLEDYITLISLSYDSRDISMSEGIFWSGQSYGPSLFALPSGAIRAALSVRSTMTNAASSLYNKPIIPIKSLFGNLLEASRQYSVLAHLKNMQLMISQNASPYRANVDEKNIDFPLFIPRNGNDAHHPFGCCTLWWPLNNTDVYLKLSDIDSGMGVLTITFIMKCNLTGIVPDDRNVTISSSIRVAGQENLILLDTNIESKHLNG